MTGPSRRPSPVTSQPVPEILTFGAAEAARGPRFGEELCLRAAETIETASDAITPITPAARP